MDLTSILQVYWSDRDARDRFHAVAHDELSRLAEACLKSAGPKSMLDTQGLIGEAYLHLFGGAEVQWQNRVHFYSFMYRTMRNILIDQHRRRIASKRGGGVEHFPVREDDASIDSLADTIEILDLLEDLSRSSVLTARIAGLILCEQRTAGDIAALLRVHDGLTLSEREVEKHWQFAQARIKQRLTKAPRTMA